MATPLVGSKQEIFQEDVDVNSANSEALQTKISKAALFAQDITEYPVQFTYSGYFLDNSVTTGAQRFVITKRSELRRYVLSIGETGSSTASALNIKIYDNTGAFVNDLFSAAAEPSILTASTRSNSYVGYNEAESSNIEGNVASATINYGTSNVQILEEGWQLVGEVVSNGALAFNADLTLILQRLE